MLASHADRDRTICSLQNAFLDGQLNENELEERVSQALSVRTKEDLDLITVDIRELVIAHQPSEIPSTHKGSAIAIFSGIERKGQFTVPMQFRSVAVFGGLELDLRSAIFTSPVTKLSIVAVFGGVHVILPEGMRVFLHQVPVLGGMSSKILNQSLPANAPSIHINGVAVLGGIEVITAKS